MLLTLLPQKNIIEGFEYVKQQVLNEYPENITWRRFMKRMHGKWIVDVKPIGFSIFEKNDAVNDYNTKYFEYLNSRMRLKMTATKFLCKQESFLNILFIV